VICNEVVDFVKKISQGVDFSPEHLALDLIEKVGPEGNYLAEEHTFRHFREEFWFPQLLDHNNYDGWIAAGGKTLAEKAHHAAEKIFQDHSAKPLDSAVKAKFDEILRKGE
jgi:trimethylamine--corrinoid protein Co-methyltransferase